MCALVFLFRSCEDVLCAAGLVLVDVPGLVLVDGRDPKFGYWF